MSAGLDDLTVLGLIVSGFFLFVGAVDLAWGWAERHDIPFRIDQATRARIAKMRASEETGARKVVGRW